MDPIIEGRAGRIANTAGDSLVAAFESPVDAVLAAIEIQTAHKAFNAGRGVGKEVLFRIGINIGDVDVQPNGDVLGAGVNIAARLQAIAQPGGICVSENVFEQVNRKLPSDLRHIGEHYVKNIEKPIHVYAIDNNNRTIFGDFKRVVLDLDKKPVFRLAGISLAILVGIFAIATRSSYPEWANQAAEEGDFSGLSREEILAKFDLVTEGGLGASNYYVIRFWGGLTIEELSKLAEALGGNIVAINSAEENQYLFDLSLADSGHWIVQELEDGPQSSGPMIGLIQEPGSTEPAQGWHWLNGDPVTFLGWKESGPDNSGGHQSFAQFRAFGSAAQPTWDDIGSVQSSVVIEVPNGSAQTR